MELRGSRPLLLGLTLLLVSLSIAPAIAAQEGQVPSDEPPTMTIDVYLGAGEQDPFDIYPEELTVQPGARVTFHVVNLQATGHDLTFLSSELFSFNESDMRAREDGGEAVKTPLLDAGEEYNLTVTFNEDAEGAITYICSVPGHRDNGMEGTLNVGAAGGEEQDVTDYGVDYLAYWVGIISFVILFIVLFGTFFLFRYGESKQVADHRTGGPQTVTVAAGAAEGEGREMVEPILPSPRSVGTVLAILALIGAAFYFLL